MWFLWLSPFTDCFVNLNNRPAKKTHPVNRNSNIDQHASETMWEAVRTSYTSNRNYGVFLGTYAGNSNNSTSNGYVRYTRNYVILNNTTYTTDYNDFDGQSSYPPLLSTAGMPEIGIYNSSAGKISFGSGYTGALWNFNPSLLSSEYMGNLFVDSANSGNAKFISEGTSGYIQHTTNVGSNVYDYYITFKNKIERDDNNWQEVRWETPYTTSSFRPIVGLGNLPITTDISQNADKIFQFGLYVSVSNSATDSVKIYEYTTDGTDRNVDASGNGGGSVPHYQTTFTSTTDWSVRVKGDTVEYLKDGTVFHTSLFAPVYPLYVKVAFARYVNNTNGANYAPVRKLSVKVPGEQLLIPDWSGNYLVDVSMNSYSLGVPETLENVEKFTIDYTDYNDKNMKDFLTTIGNETQGVKAYLHILDITNSDNYLVYLFKNHTSITADYGEIGVSFVEKVGNITLTDNTNYKLQLIPMGSRGSQGYQGHQGYQGYTGFQGFQGYQGDIVNWWNSYESKYSSSIIVGPDSPPDKTFGLINTGNYIIDISGTVGEEAKWIEAEKFRLSNLVSNNIVQKNRKFSISWLYYL